ncbi:linoleate diol synthase precursor [Lasiosphaeria ovina]|uniref:Linoleate diol synthase n=1 Tax=Lasiosphaeria ovina TaxID=92902 RepID=A0AAE0KCH3_9PEZI|nr:linoleate diol synthase precursor [Lasiosphaeria ovina]
MVSKLAGLNKVLKKAFSPEAKYPYVPVQGNDEPETTQDLIGDIKALGFKDHQTLLAFLNAAVSGTVDDNDLLLESIIQLLAKLPPTSKEGKQLTDGLITQLWSALDHPPTTSLGENFRFRAPDGSGNNVNHPILGAANTPYARTVPAMTLQSPNQPDPSVIFDSLMSRGDTFEQHPQGISSMLFYLATIITHDVFQTSSSDYNVNLTSSYLDLSPLYGRNEGEQAAVRTFKDGLLKPDCFSSKRILGFPPGCGVFLIMFNRFHNYVVTQLAKINENGRFNKPDPSRLTDSDALAAAWKKYDNELFQTGRLITCGLYGNIILKDYVRTILALNRTESTWVLDPRSKSGKNIFSQPSPSGVGNQVSAEFNLIYRWHSTISEKDEKWTIELFKQLLDGRDPSQAKLGDVLKALARFEHNLPDDPGHRVFAKLSRQADGTFDDDALVKVLQESVDDVAGSFGANRVPDCLKTIEVLGIMQARYWNVATLNEFRSFMGLTKHRTFEDINPDPVVAKKLKDLYDSPDAVEFYPGLVAEKAKPPMTPGSGLCVNYTTSRAILSDAVTLIRGDRFYTVDYTPKNITNWGYNEANSDLTVNQGCVMHKLIFRAFPNHFAQNSIYAHFPFVVPAENKVIHDGLGTADKYSWAKPKRKPEVVVIRSHRAAAAVLSNKKDFSIGWTEPVLHNTHPAGNGISHNFSLCGDGDANPTDRARTCKALYELPEWATEISEFCATKTAQLLAKYSIPLVAADDGGKTTVVHEVDVVRDVVGLATTHVMAAMFALPVKTEGHPYGIYTEQELFRTLTAIFSSIFFDMDVAASFKLRNTSQALVQQLGSLIAVGAKAGRLGDLARKVEGAVYASPSELSLPSFGSALVARFIEHEAGSVEDAVWGSMIMVVCSGVATQTQMLSQCLDYYLGTGAAHLPELHRLANLNTKEADQALTKYMLEGSRLRGPAALFCNVETDQTITDYAPCKPDPQDPTLLNPVPNENPEPTTLTLKAGSRVFVDLTAASHDADAFPDPEQVRLDRPLDAYLHYGIGPHQCLGREMSRVMMTAVFKAVVGLPGLRRAGGPRGELKSFPATTWNGQVGRDAAANTAKECKEWSGLRAYMTADERAYSPLPTTMRVRYQG